MLRHRPLEPGSINTLFSYIHSLEMSQGYMDFMFRRGPIKHEKEAIAKVQQFGNGFCVLSILSKSDGTYLIYELANVAFGEDKLVMGGNLELAWFEKVNREQQEIVKFQEKCRPMISFISPPRFSTTGIYASNQTYSVVSLKNVEEISFLFVPRNYSDVCQRTMAHFSYMARENRNSYGIPSPEWKATHPSPMKNFMKLFFQIEEESK
jgi:hypothetical protein